MANFLTAECLPRLVELISKPRLSPYMRACNDNLSQAFELYAWNLELGASFYAPLAILEIVVRNAMHRELTALFGASWHRNEQFQRVGTKIIEARLSVVSGRPPQKASTDILTQPAKIDGKLRAERARKMGPTSPIGTKEAPTTDDIVASLDFGYWTSLLNRDVENTLYAAGLYKAFPHAPHARKKKPHRAQIAEKLRDLRIFRNRVMHHEPLFNRKSIRKDLQSIIEVCGWIAPTAEEWVKHLSKVEATLETAPIPLR